MSDITRHVFKLLTIVFVNLVVSTTLAADPVATESKASDSKTTESKLADTKISEFSPTSSLKVISINPTQANLGQQITIKVDGLADAIKLGKEKFELGKLILYIDGYRLDGLNAESIDPLNDTITITLGRNDKNKDKWISLLGSPYPLIRAVKVNLGYGDQQILPSASEQHIELIVIKKEWLMFYVALLLGTLIIFYKLATKSNIIRDSNPPMPEPGKKPFSLAKFQASFWFFLIFAAFLFIWIVTGDLANTMTEQALILMGIGTGTALGAAMIDSSKRENVDIQLDKLNPDESKLNAEVLELKAKISNLQSIINANPPGTSENMEELSKSNIQLAEKEAQLRETNDKIAEVKTALSKPVSEGFMRDLLTDANGISFHRFQMLVWTFVLGFIFVVEVFKTLRMPEFSPTLLALMGISAGTYLGFKIPERVS
ncbi:hypothetical protein [Nitrosomonas sp. Is79A3]|uniref:hypothetical protein n=1 Tax=Nitrosomonas sp. (strain Is79A3) TaxID=261292 RepID=UPI00059CBB78